MDPYGMDSDQGSMGGFFEFNRMMSEMSRSFATTNENFTNVSKYTNEISNTNKCTFFQTGMHCLTSGCKCRSYTAQRRSSTEPIKFESIHQVRNVVPSQNIDTPKPSCTYSKDGKGCRKTTCNQCCPQYERISSLSPDRDEKSATPVRDEPPTVTSVIPQALNGDERPCSYFRKGLPCPFPACKYKCYDVSEKLPIVAKRQPSPNADPNVKLCDYYKYDRPCPFPRCRYKCHDSADKQKHFEMGYIKPIVNMNSRIHGGDIDHRQMRDVDHRVANSNRRDSWESKCDDFIRNMFDSKPSTSPPPTEDETTSDKQVRKRKSSTTEEPEASSRKRSKKKRSRDRDDETEKSPSKKKKSKKDKKEKKEKKSKRAKKERSKHERKSSKEHERSRTASKEYTKPMKVMSGSLLDSTVDAGKEIQPGSKPPAAIVEASPAFVEFIVKNFRKSSKKKLPMEIQLEGLFNCEEKERAKYSTEEAKIEWITRKTLSFLNDSGYDEDKIYDVSTLMDGETLEKELKNVVYDAVKLGKIGHSKSVISQLFHVIELGKYSFM